MTEEIQYKRDLKNVDWQEMKQLLEIDRASLPLRELKPVPEPKFQTELVNLKKAKFELNSIVEEMNNFDSQFQLMS